MWNFEKNYCDIISKNTEGFIKQKGYSIEKHTVTTEDGYINTMYRIPHGKSNEIVENSKTPPVILSHGMSCSCAEFTNQGNLAYFLADQGFDVWLPNNRGTTYSRTHKDLDPEKDAEKYWNFSWHEIGYYDNPAFIDYVLEKTGFEKLYFIGHSQGATSYVVTMSERPVYNEKIALGFLLGPGIIFENVGSYKIDFLSGLLVPAIEKTHYYLNLPIFEMPFINFTRFLSSLPKPNTILHQVAQFLFFFVAGHANYEQSNIDFSQFSLTTPNSFSIRQAYHYSQIARNKRFAKYDYGPDENLQIYGSTKPPLYDLSKVTSPTTIFYGKNDMYNDAKDIDILEKMLGNVVHKQAVDNDLFNHGDFLMAKDSGPLLYCHISKLMKEFK